MSNLISIPTENWDSEADFKVEQLLKEYDGNCMPIPSVDSDPHLLLSKVRKHYMEYLIKLLSVNYENNQKLVNKNIYLPSAIWRCAKNIEMLAAKSCMVVQIYRKNIVNVIKELKKDTKNAKLNKNLYECLHKPPDNEKKLQTSFMEVSGCDCQCTCNSRKKLKTHNRLKKINFDQSVNYQLKPNEEIIDTVTNTFDFNKDPSKDIQFEFSQSNNPIRMSIESQESGDDLMMQLEKLFQEDPNDDDLFEGTLYSSLDLHTNDREHTQQNTDLNTPEVSQNPLSNTQNLIEAHAAQIKSLDARLATLAGTLVANNNNANTVSTRQPKPAEVVKNKKTTSKWLCEEYFLKTKLFEMMDLIRDKNRRKHERIKNLLAELFGEDSDDEGAVSPLEETSDFVLSCKERIAPWVVKLLTPYYTKGRIRGKALFKLLAKHLIRLIYQCSRYPEQYEVTSFVSDFLANHKMIRSEADFKEFKIQNL